MANCCAFEMKVKGRQKDLLEFVSVIRYQHPDMCFCRVGVEELWFEDGSLFVNGEVAWSLLYGFMPFGGKKDSAGHEIADINEVSKKLHLEVEMFSTEIGIGFQEHFIFCDGKKVMMNCIDYCECYYDPDEYSDELTDEERCEAFKYDYRLSKDVSIDDLDEDGYYISGGVENYGVWTI